MPPPRCSRFLFLIEEIVKQPYTFGRDLPEEHRKCGICLETIEDDSFTVQNCPTAPNEHNFHILCIFTWLSTWPQDDSDGPNRTCPLCRTTLYIQHRAVVAIPSKEILELREAINNSWESLLTTATERFPPARDTVGPHLGYVDRRIAYDAADRFKNIEATRLVTILGDRYFVEFKRAEAFLTDVKGFAGVEAEIAELKGQLAHVERLRVVLDELSMHAGILSG